MSPLKLRQKSRGKIQIRPTTKRAHNHRGSKTVTGKRRLRSSKNLPRRRHKNHQKIRTRLDVHKPNPIKPPPRHHQPDKNLPLRIRTGLGHRTRSPPRNHRRTARIHEPLPTIPRPPEQPTGKRVQLHELRTYFTTLIQRNTTLLQRLQLPKRVQRKKQTITQSEKQI